MQDRIVVKDPVFIYMKPYSIPTLTVSDAFLDKLLDRVKKLKMGPNHSQSTDIGPLIDATQMHRVLEFIKYAKLHKEGNCVIGGSRYGTKGCFVEPTVFTNVDGMTMLL